MILAAGFSGALLGRLRLRVVAAWHEAFRARSRTGGEGRGLLGSAQLRGHAPAHARAASEGAASGQGRRLGVDLSPPWNRSLNWAATVSGGRAASGSYQVQAHWLTLMIALATTLASTGSERPVGDAVVEHADQDGEVVGA